MSERTPLSRAHALSEDAGQRLAAGDVARAEARLRQAIALRDEADLGAHPAQRDDQYALAALLHGASRMEEAEVFARAALAEPGTARGPQLAERLAELMHILHKTGRPEEAEPLARRLVALHEEPPARDTQYHAKALCCLAMVLVDLERMEEAEPLLVRAVAILKGACGPDHRGVATILGWLGRFPEARGDFAAAEAVFREALDISTRAGPGGDRTTGEILASLGRVLQRDRRPEEAVRPLRRSVAIMASDADGDPAERIAALKDLATALADLECYGEAADVYREQRGAIEAAFGRDHADTEQATFWLAWAIEMDDRPDEAIALLRDALSEVRSREGHTSPACMPALDTLASTLARSEQWEEVKALYREGLAITETAFGRADPACSNAVNNLAWAIGLTGRYEEAEAMHREALALRARSPGPASEEYFGSVANLSWVLWQAGRQREARAVIDAGLATIRSDPASGVGPVASALERVAIFFHEEGDLDAAAEFYRQAVDVLANAFGPTDERTTAMRAELHALRLPGNETPTQLQ